MEEQMKPSEKAVLAYLAGEAALKNRSMTDDVALSICRGKSVEEAFDLHDARFRQEYARAAEAWSQVTAEGAEDAQFLRGFDAAFDEN